MSGNSLILLALALLILAGCSTARRGQQTGRTPLEPSREDLPLVYNPATGEYEPVKDPRTLIDTVSWNVVEGESAIGPAEELRTGKKDVYRMAFLIPFNAMQHQYIDEQTDPRTRRFINYYAGVRLALESLASEGIDIEARVMDTEESADKTERLLHDLRDYDVIVGPYSRESLAVASTFAAEYKIPVISPWTPAVNVPHSNPYFVQMMPGLSTHAEATIAYITEHFQDPRIFIVSRGNEREASRVELYLDAFRKRHPYSHDPPVHLVISDSTVTLDETDLSELLTRERTHVFILPYYSRRDEDFLNAFLRKLHADRGSDEVYVFGLPQWTSFRGLNPNYLESLNVHVSAVNFVDNTLPETKAFSEIFYDRYASVPEPAAMQGYQLTRYLGKALFTYGVRFLDQLPDGGIGESFDPQPVFMENTSPESGSSIMYYENRSIELLRFEDQAFHSVE